MDDLDPTSEEYDQEGKLDRQFLYAKEGIFEEHEKSVSDRRYLCWGQTHMEGVGVSLYVKSIEPQSNKFHPSRSEAVHGMTSVPSH